MVLKRRQRGAGFTLIEVIVALAVIAVVMAALHTASRSAIRGGGYLEERTLAHWIAANELARMQLDATWPDIGNQEGFVDMAQRRWHWQARIEPTPEPDVRRIEFSVALLVADQAAHRAALTGFVTP